MNAKTVLAGTLSLVGVAVLSIAGTLYYHRVPQAAPPVLAPMIALEKLGHLVSLRVNYSDIVQFYEKRAIDLPFNREIPLGGINVLLVAKGECTISTNLGQAKYEKIDREAKTLTVFLPTPQALSVRISHDGINQGGSYFYTVTEKGLGPLLPDDGKRTKAMDSAMVQAQSQLKRACMSTLNIASAKENAESVLRSMYLSTEWKPTFVWTNQAAAH